MKKKVFEFKNGKPSAFIAAVLALAVLISTFSGMFILADNDSWDGTPSSGYAEGSGTKGDPYIVSTPAELLLTVSSTGLAQDGTQLYYKMVNNIYVNNVTDSTWKGGEGNNLWPVVSTSDDAEDTAFGGVFDGDGYKVFGLYVNKTYTAPEGDALDTSVATGLFPSVKGSAKISAVGLENSYFSLTNNSSVASLGYAGYVGLVGYAYNTNGTDPIALDRCYVGEDVTVKSGYAGLVAGLMGTVWKSAVKVTNCYSSGFAPYYMAGHGTISALYWDYSSEARYTEGAEGLVDINELIKGVYTDKGEVKHGNNYIIADGDAMRGTDAAKSYPAFDFNTVWKAVDKGTPVLQIFGLKGEDIDISEDGVIFASGTGKKNNPYIIETVAQLRYLMESTATEGKYYKLANDLYINDTSKAGRMQNSPSKWYSYGANMGPVFKGTFDGDGHYVYGVYIDDTPQTGETIINGSAGLFPNVMVGATVKNLHLRDSYISGNAYTGGIIGYVTGTTAGQYVNLIGCSADKSVTVKGQNAGGLVGGGGAVTNLQYVYFTGTVEATSEGRGNALVGDVWKNGQRLAQAYTIGYTNYRANFYPYQALDVYAKWVQRGFINGFETDVDMKYDLNEGTELFRPGSKGYNPKFIHGGMRSMRTIPDGATESVFLLNYKNPFEIGQEYDVNFWIYVKNGDATGSVQFLQALHPQFDSPVVGYTEAVALGEAKKGTWVQYRVTVTANAPYLLIKTAQGNEIFYDDFQVVPTGNEGELGKIDGFNPTGLSEEPSIISDAIGAVLGLGAVGIIILVALGVLALALIVVAVIVIILIVRKSKKKKAQKAAAAAQIEDETPKTEE